MQQHETIPTLDYRVGDGAPVRWGRTVALAMVLGLASGLAWLVVGEWLDGPLGNEVAWFVCPLAFPLALSLLASLRARRHWRISLAQGVTFVGCFYAAHLLPLAVVIAPYYFGGVSP